MIIGYARESADHQDLLLQLKALKKFGCEKIFQDKSVSFKSNPELEQMVHHLQKGDIVVIWKLDRIGRSLKYLINLINFFREIEVDFVSIRDHIDSRTTQGRLFYKLTALFAEFDKEFNMERIVSVAEPERKQHRKGGRPKGLSIEAIIKARKAKQLYENDKKPVADIAHSIGIGKTTLYRYLHYTGADIADKKETGLFMADRNGYKSQIRKELISKLIDSKAFWSYSNISCGKIPDDVLIQKVMEELDIDDIIKLFIVYNKNYVRKVWKNQMVAQDPYYRSLNILLAKLFFNIKKPEEYIRKVKNERY
jgi:DNA invertase Pin-like site-specific DNA recombinase